MTNQSRTANRQIHPRPTTRRPIREESSASSRSGHAVLEAPKRETEDNTESRVTGALVMAASIPIDHTVREDASLAWGHQPDMSCQNVSLYRRNGCPGHPLDHRRWLALLHAQLKHSPDGGIGPLRNGSA